jgi:rubrerythrin
MIDLAMSFERDQLSLQRDMGTVLGEKHRDQIDEIIKEEMGHLVALSRLKKKLET